MVEWERLLSESGLINESRIPLPVMATPNAVSGVEQDEISWWRPSFADTCRSIGWRWIFLLPSTLLILLLVIPSTWIGILVLLEAKLLLLTGAIALTLASVVFRRAARARTEPFCIFCGYNLTGLPDHYRCPECGRPYTWRLIAEYRKDPQWFIDRYKALRRLPPAAAPFESGPVRRPRRRDGT